MTRISTITPEVNLYGRQTGIENTMFNTFKSNKDYMKNLRNYILNVIKEDFKDNYGLAYPSEENLMNHFIKRFESEFNHPYNKREYPRIHRRIENYLLGLAYNFVYTYHWGYRKVTGKTINSWNKESMRKHLYDMVSYSSGKGKNTSNYYFQMITQEIIKLLKKHKLFTKKLSI